MNLNKLSDKIVFSSLKYIKHGTLKIINHDGKEYNFGHNLSFGGGSGSPLLFRYDKDDNFWFGDYYTEIFEEN